MLERREGARWPPVGAIRLRGDATAAITVRPGSFRVRVAAAPGYVATASLPATSR